MRQSWIDRHPYLREVGGPGRKSLRYWTRGWNNSDKESTTPSSCVFFEGRNFKEVGAALGASEDAAKMRVNRALEKLRKFWGMDGHSGIFGQGERRGNLSCRSLTESASCQRQSPRHCGSGLGPVDVRSENDALRQLWI